MDVPVLEAARLGTRLARARPGTGREESTGASQRVALDRLARHRLTDPRVAAEAGGTAPGPAPGEGGR